VVKEMIDFDKLRKHFPHLADEIEKGKSKVYKIGGFRREGEGFEELRNPDVISFIRRCDTDEQALEIINFMEKRGEITPEYASQLRSQLREKGVRSFGPKKEPGYYFHRYYHQEEGE